MRRWTAILTLLFATVAVVCPKPTFAQQEDTDGKRKVTNKVTPDYPEMARRMNLRGIVRVDVMVASNGTVKNVEIKGGHPVLVHAAVAAVKKWKWEPASHDTKEPVEVKFDNTQ
jgi:TonB family protein